MDSDRFWRLIEDARRAVGGHRERLAALLTDRLAAWPPEEIVAFQRALDERMAESYTFDLWAAAYIINGGCSDDGFDYFRGWLIAQGECVFRNALRDPETLLDVAEAEVECEVLLGVAYHAHERATGGALRYHPTAQIAEPAGVPWDEATVDAKYPRLAARFSQ